MSEAYQGNPANVTTPLSATVTGASNTTPIVITTTSQVFQNGDSVLIAGVGGNLAANGLWVIAVISPGSTFSLVGSVGTGAYTSGGTAVDQSLTPPASVFQDGIDDLDAVHLNAAVSTALDRTQFLQAGLTALAAALPGTQAFTFTAALAPTTIATATAIGQTVKCFVSGGHGLLSGLTVTISGATGMTALNGTFLVTVLDSTHFTIPLTATGSYGASSGTCTPVVPAGVNWMIVDGWGGGGGGEGGGGGANLAGATTTTIGPYVQGGGAQGAPRTTLMVPVVPLSALAVTIGAAGLGGTGATSAGPTPATAGSAGGLSTVIAGATEVVCLQGDGAGAAQWLNILAAPVTFSAVIAPGGSQRSQLNSLGTTNREWPFSTTNDGGPFGFAYGSLGSNIANFIDHGIGSGGAAVLVYATSAPAFNPSTKGIGGNGQGYTDGGAPGTPGALALTGGTTYLGGPGGGGGGGGPNGPGGQGGNGSNGNAAGSSTGGAALNAPNTFAGNTGAGGGGGGTAGACSTGTPGQGGAGGNGDTGQVSLYWVASPPDQVAA